MNLGKCPDTRLSWQDRFSLSRFQLTNNHAIVAWALMAMLLRFRLSEPGKIVGLVLVDIKLAAHHRVPCAAEFRTGQLPNHAWILGSASSSATTATATRAK